MIKICKHDGCSNEAQYSVKRGRYNGTECDTCQNLRRNYGITTPQRDKMAEAQGHKCAICSESISFHKNEKGMGGSAAVDHCHDTLEIRGILCNSCNRGLGNLSTETLLQNAIKYLNGGS